MNTGKIVFSQLLHVLPRYEFNKCVEGYQGNKKVRDFPCWSQFLCMAFAQLSHRESLRDIEVTLNSHHKKLYHMGLPNRVAKSTLADANYGWLEDVDGYEHLMLHVRGIPHEDT